MNYSRISSYFTSSRHHPILKEKRPHPGIDYAAPKNTPVKTVADGIIKKMGYNNTMGRYMIIRHVNGYDTSYYHLNGFAKDLKKGASVSQGDVIGYVGKPVWPQDIIWISGWQRTGSTLIRWTSLLPVSNRFLWKR